MKNNIRKVIRKHIDNLFENKSYLTHDNGGRPFSVHKTDEFLYIFKHTLQVYDNVLKVFSGGKEDENSSVLIELAARGKDKKDPLYYKDLKHKYLFVGSEVYVFESDEPITKFYTVIGNSDVPYPIALSENLAFFMLDKVYIDKSEFPEKIEWKNAYDYFYRHKGEKKIYKKHKFQNYKLIEKSPLKESVKTKKLGNFSLDSGSVVFIDPSHLNDISSEVEIMSKGKLKTNKNQVKQVKTGLYLSLFGGDGTFDVYGVYDPESKWPHLPYKLVIHARNKEDFPEGMSLYESTLDYYPGYSDDGTSDWLSTIRDKSSTVLNKELKKIEDKVLKSGCPKGSEEGNFWQKWLYANMITTSLQDGFYVEPVLVKKAIKYYEECLNNKKIKEFTRDSYKIFKSQVEETLNALKKEKPMDEGHQKGMHYAPGFMDTRQRNHANSKKGL